MNTKKNTHLTLDDRIEIQECLSHGMSFKAIGKRIGKDQTTVSKEVKKHIAISPTTTKRVDKDGKAVVALCPKLLKPPFVCNPCPKAHSSCGFDRHIYRAKTAHSEYERLLSQAREGIPLTKQEFYVSDKIIADGIRNGQHLYHIAKSNELCSSIPTVYRHLKKGYLSIASVDLPRAVKFKPRKAHHAPRIPKSLKDGRTYEDFLLFKEKNEIGAWVEMDSIIGRIGGKAILTLHFFPSNFMVGLLLDDHTALQVSLRFLELRTTFTQNEISFSDFFRVILTDNGGEFANVFDIENNLCGNKETNLFFCDPYQSSQKPHVEKNHTILRDIAPKGTSFDRFSQEKLYTVFSHVNSVKRQSLGGKSPFETFAFWFGDNAPALFNITQIMPSAVVQSPKLLQTLGI